MAEAVKDYAQRILNTLGEADPVQVLSETPARLDAVLKKFSPEQLRKRPTPNQWSPAEIVIHLSEVEIAVGFRVRLVVGQNGIGIQGFDQDAWATRYNRAGVNDALAAFQALRKVNLAMYGALTPDQWENYGMHSERGRETARRIVEMCAGHDLNHLQQLERIQP